MAGRHNRVIGNSLVALLVAGMAAPLLAQNAPIEGKQGLGKLPNVRPASMQIKLPVPVEAPANPATSAPAKAEPKAAPQATPTPAASPVAAPAPAPTASPAPAPATPPTMVIVPNPVPVAHWTLADAKELLTAIRGLGVEGLYPADYQPAALQAAIAAGEGEALDQQASRSFAWAVEDLRDGRTPMPARVQWFAVDPDQDDMTTQALLERATTNHDVHATLDSLTPTYPDYQALKDALAATPKAQVKLRESIRINMDRWRWLPRDLGQIYLITNVPEFQLRLTVNGKAIRTYRTVVGKPGKTATPQLAEMVEAVVFNPTWTVPQSIVVGEGLGEKLIGNPASALKQGYKVTRLGDGSISVVQQQFVGSDEDRYAQSPCDLSA
jgi:murein L,D-transpeptidase YcbB/YkuD